MPRLVRATPVPLFDRLTGWPEGADDGASLDPPGLHASLARDLERLFNTRSRRTIAGFLEEELSVLDYGLPDLTALPASSQAAAELVAEVVRRALDCFEPRLSLVEVRATGVPGQRPARVAIAGAVRVGLQMRRVAFERSLEPLEGQPA